MTVATSPETFVVDETVSYFEGEHRTEVKVVSVKGDRVTVDAYGQKVTFAPRASDGMHVKEGSPDHEVMPTMIYHRNPEAPKAENSVKEWLTRFLLG